MKKKNVNVIVVLTVIAIVCELLCNLYYNKLYGGRKTVEFPFEMVSELPPEPDWYKENVFDQILSDQTEEKEIQEWFRRICREDKYVVNKSGDPIPLMSCDNRSVHGITFYNNNNNNGNVVAVYNTIGGQLKRIEIPEKSICKKSLRCSYIEQEIANGWDNCYVDYQNNNTLYYYVNGGMLKIDDNVHQLEGHFYNSVATFPILEKNGKILSYILEDAESEYMDEFEYITIAKKIKIRKVIFSDLETSCDVEDIGLGEQRVYTVNEKGIMQFYVRKDLKEGKYDVQQIFSLLQKEDFIKKEAKEKKYVYIDRSLGYDDPWLW